MQEIAYFDCHASGSNPPAKDWGKIASGYNGKSYKNSNIIKSLNVNITTLKVKYCVIIFALSPTFSLAQDFYANLVRIPSEKAAIIKATDQLAENADVDISQTVKISTVGGYFFIVPLVSTKPQEQAGCYIQVVSSMFKLGSKYLVEKSEDAQSCDAVEAIYTCKLSKAKGVGVISGIRLGANHYFSSNTFFDLNKNNQFSINHKLTKKINTIETVLKSKKILGCIQ